MLVVIAVLSLFLLPLQTNGLITTDAKCLAGYEWTFSSIGQSPCDIAAELASVCAPGGQFNLSPLPVGYEYVGPTLENVNACRCSTVYYSLLSACAYCQGRDYIGWGGYSTNCTTAYLTTTIPSGVKVPAYAYENISTSGSFDVTLAQSMKGAESSGPTQSTSTPGSYHSPTNTSTSSNHIPAIVGGVVGGVVALGALGAIIMFFCFSARSKRRAIESHKLNVQQIPTTPNTIAPLIPPRMSPLGSPAPNSIGKVYDPNDPSTYPSADPSMYDPYRQSQMPVNQNVAPNFTGSSMPPQTTPQHTGGRTYFTGVPEL